MQNDSKRSDAGETLSCYGPEVNPYVLLRDSTRITESHILVCLLLVMCKGKNVKDRSRWHLTEHLFVR